MLQGFGWRVSTSPNSSGIRIYVSILLLNNIPRSVTRVFKNLVGFFSYHASFTKLDIIFCAVTDINLIRYTPRWIEAQERTWSEDVKRISLLDRCFNGHFSESQKVLTSRVFLRWVFILRQRSARGKIISPTYFIITGDHCPVVVHYPPDVIRPHPKSWPLIGQTSSLQLVACAVGGTFDLWRLSGSDSDLLPLHSVLYLFWKYSCNSLGF